MKTLLLTLVVGMLVGVPAHAQVVEWLTNGDFEDTSGEFPQGWTIGGGLPGITSGLAGTANAAVMYPDLFGGSLTQSGLQAGPEWALDMYFAAAAPPTSDDRSLQFVLNTGGAVINMRVNGDGNVQSYGGQWQDLIPGGVTFSTDATGDGDFDDPGDTLNVHRLRLVGDFTTAPSYEVMMSAPGSDSFTMTSGAVSVFDGTPIPNTGIASVSMRSQASTAPYVVDQISLMAEEAPTLPFSGVVNGDFEDLSGTFPNGWTLVSDAIAPHTGLDGSATGLLMMKQNDGGGRVEQSFFPTNPSPEWEMDLQFAMEDPGDTNDRGLNLILPNEPNNGNLNLRVNGDGTIQTVTSTPSVAWVDVPNLSNAVEFSVDGNGDGDFDDPEDTLNVYRLVLQGDYSTANPEYTVSLSGANSTDLVLSGGASNWFTSPPGEGSSIGSLSISAARSGGNYVVDNILVRSLAVGPGDFDGDGDVDAADFLAWQRGESPDPLSSTDLATWQQNYGTGGLQVNSIAVPEPKCLLLLLIGGLWSAVVCGNRAISLRNLEG